MIDSSERLRYLVEQDAFAICPLLMASDFVKFCKERGVGTSEEQLERFEKLRILVPVARMKRPWVTHKIEYIDEGRRYRDHGLLQEGANWSGDTKSEWGTWRRRDAADDTELLQEGHLWDPATMPFEPWTSFRDEHGAHTETYYSMFQAYPLEWKQMWLSCRVDTSVFADGGDPAKVGAMIAEGAADRVDALARVSVQDDVAFLAQALSTRYYPLTRTDRRTFTLSEQRFRWDWYAYGRGWDAAACARAVGVDQAELRDRQQTVGMIAQSRDPLHRWYQLVRFIAVDKKDQLTGSAQYSQLLYAIEFMFRMFAKDAFAVDLHPPDEDHTWKNEDLYGKGIPDDPLRHLELVVNDYHLNPRPKLILVVEGPGEEGVVPRIVSEAMGHSLSALGIEVRPLGGVGEFTGKKRIDKLGALEKFIDDYHYRQSPVVIVLDNEGRVETVMNNLRVAKSKRYPSRMLTKPEYLRMWQRSIEFDNFTYEEIAQALSAVAKGHATFTAADVNAAQQAYDRKEADPLSALFLARIGRDLNKIDCLGALADLLIAAVRQSGYEAEKAKRPLLEILDEVINLAALNHQPVTFDTWKLNQESGYFGPMLPQTP